MCLYILFFKKQSYFKFFAIRNPFDKLISILYFRNRKTDWNVEDPVKLFRL